MSLFLQRAAGQDVCPQVPEGRSLANMPNWDLAPAELEISAWKPVWDLPFTTKERSVLKNQASGSASCILKTLHFEISQHDLPGEATTRTEEQEFGSCWRETLKHCLMELQPHCSGPGRAESASLNVSVNAVRGGEKKGNDPPPPPSSAKQVEGVLITLAFVSADG